MKPLANPDGAADWDRRYSEQDLVFSAEPTSILVELTAGLPPGRALDLGAGEGRNALWLAQQGWRVTAVDFSRAGLAKAERRARESGLDISCVAPDPQRRYTPERLAGAFPGLQELRRAAVRRPPRPDEKPPGPTDTVVWCRRPPALTPRM